MEDLIASAEQSGDEFQLKVSKELAANTRNIFYDSGIDGVIKYLKDYHTQATADVKRLSKAGALAPGMTKPATAAQNVANQHLLDQHIQSGRMFIQATTTALSLAHTPEPSTEKQQSPPVTPELSVRPQNLSPKAPSKAEPAEPKAASSSKAPPPIPASLQSAGIVSEPVVGVATPTPATQADSLQAAGTNEPAEYGFDDMAKKTWRQFKGNLPLLAL